MVKQEVNDDATDEEEGNSNEKKTISGIHRTSHLTTNLLMTKS
jgi:hypothetical protein